MKEIEAKKPTIPIMKHGRRQHPVKLNLIRKKKNKISR